MTPASSSVSSCSASNSTVTFYLRIHTDLLRRCGEVHARWFQHYALTCVMCAGSVDGLVEASRQSRVCGGAANEIMCAIFRVLMEVSCPSCTVSSLAHGS